MLDIYVKITLALLVVNGYFLWRHRRSLFIGVLVTVSLLIFAGSSLVLLIQSNIAEENEILRLCLIAGAMIVLLILMWGPLVIAVTLLINGVRLLRKEGFSLGNLLSLALGIAMFIVLIFTAPILQWLEAYPILSYLYGTLVIILLYALLVASIYMISGWINQIHIHHKKHLHYIVVLGSGLINNQVPPLLASRITKGIALLKHNPEATLIMSGGQGEDEEMPEGVAMRDFAIARGVSEEKVLAEKNSKNTRENLRFSYNLMEKPAKIAIVTNHYHLFRALLIAKEENIPCIGYGAKTKFYFSSNAFLREFVAYLVMKKKFHLLVLSFLLLLYGLSLFILEAIPTYIV